MTTLVLSSPETKGALVKETQKLLSDNPYGTFYAGLVDGEYGIVTAQAAYRAKYRLGYPLEDINQEAGDLLRSYLSGSKPLSPANLARRKARAVSTTPLRVKALTEAKKYIGRKESPFGSNHTWLDSWWGFGGFPWCAVFISYCYANAGSKLFQAGKYSTYCPYLVADTRAGNKGLTITKDPQPGDIVLYDWQGDGISDHVGIFEAWAPMSRTSFTAIEGNTGVGNDSNGGEVMRRTRKISDVVLFAHCSV